MKNEKKNLLTGKIRLKAVQELFLKNKKKGTLENVKKNRLSDQFGNAYPLFIMI